MKRDDMLAVLVWLIEYMREFKAKELKGLKKAKPWRTLDDYSLIYDWANACIDNKLKVIQSIEDILSKLKLIRYNDHSNSDKLRKSALLKIVQLMNIKENDRNISRDKLEELIIGFVKALA